MLCKRIIILFLYTIFNNKIIFKNQRELKKKILKHKKKISSTQIRVLKNTKIYQPKVEMQEK